MKSPTQLTPNKTIGSTNPKSMTIIRCGSAREFAARSALTNASCQAGLCLIVLFPNYQSVASFPMKVSRYLLLGTYLRSVIYYYLSLMEPILLCLFYSVWDKQVALLVESNTFTDNGCSATQSFQSQRSESHYITARQGVVLKL